MKNAAVTTMRAILRRKQHTTQKLRIALNVIFMFSHFGGRGRDLELDENIKIQKNSRKA